MFIYILVKLRYYLRLCFTEGLDQMILDVIINAHLPFNLVSHESFKTLISKSYPGKTVQCRQT